MEILTLVGTLKPGRRARRLLSAEELKDRENLRRQKAYWEGVRQETLRKLGQK